MRVERSLLKSASGANKFIGILERMGMKLQSKPGGCMSVKTKLFKRLQSVRGVGDASHTEQNKVALLLFGGLKLTLGPGVFTIFDLQKMDVPLFWKELARVTYLGSRFGGCSWP
eukprot:1161498-Pelagomonas_calceolata.AAC.4